MFAISLIDLTEDKTECGVIVCCNDKVTVSNIQEMIIDIKYELEIANEDWNVSDVIRRLPTEWNISFQSNLNKVII